MRPCQAEPIMMVARPPIRSEITPQICRLRNAVPSSTDNIRAPIDRLMPRSLQKAMRWPCGMAIGMQHITPAAHINANTALGGQPRTCALTRPVPDGFRRVNHFGRLAEIDRGKRHDDNDLGAGVPQHRLPPAEIGDRLLEYGRPHRAGEIGAARDQRQRRTAPSVEPAADINVQGSIDAADPDQADKQSVADPQRPGRPEGRNREPEADHQRAR